MHGFIFLICFTALSFSAFGAQVEFNILGGANLSKNQYDSRFGRSPIFEKMPEAYWGQSWQFGLQSRLKFSAVTSLFVDLQYQNKKMGIENIDLFALDTFYPARYESSLSYVTAPIGIIIDIKKLPYLLLGAETLFLVNASSKYCDPIDCWNNNDISKAYHTTGLALILGGGYEIAWKKNSFSLEIRYSRGLTSKFKKEYEFEGSNAVENTVQFLLNIHTPLKVSF